MRRLMLIFLLLGFFSSTFSLSDPTRPSDYSGPAPGGVGKNGLHVSAVLHSHHRKVAVINGQAYSAGDQVLGTKILRINSNSVLFQNSEGSFSIKLGVQYSHPKGKSNISIERAGAKV